MRLLQLLLLVMGGCAHFMGHVHVNVPGRLDTRVNYTMFKHDGFVIVDDVFTRAEIDLMFAALIMLACLTVLLHLSVGLLAQRLTRYSEGRSESGITRSTRA